MYIRIYMNTSIYNLYNAFTFFFSLQLIHFENTTSLILYYSFIFHPKVSQNFATGAPGVFCTFKLQCLSSLSHSC